VAHDGPGGLSTEGFRIDGSHSDGKWLRYLVGKAVRQLHGKAPAKDVAEFVKTQLQQEVLR
jgi:Asp-tRNA(Asn)/Glu-tRNA(Gln) amidotransferase B subunit